MASTVSPQLGGVHLIASLKRHLLRGRKVMTNLDGLFKNRDITLPTKDRLVKAMVFFSSLMSSGFTTSMDVRVGL